MKVQARQWTGKREFRLIHVTVYITTSLISYSNWQVRRKISNDWNFRLQCSERQHVSAVVQPFYY